MRIGSIGFVALLLAVGALGCGDSNSGSNANTYTCSFAASSGVCYQWTAPQTLTSAQVSQLQTACTTGNPPGTFASGANCPSASRVGTCTLANTQVSGVTYKWVLYSPTFTAANGQTLCAAANGTWVAG